MVRYGAAPPAAPEIMLVHTGQRAGAPYAASWEPLVTDRPTRRYVEYVRLDEIKFALRNPQGHDDAGIDRSIGHFGLAELPLRDDRTGRLVAGHGRHERLVAAREAGKEPPDGVEIDDDGMWMMPVISGWASRSDDDAEAYVLASNRLTEKGGRDERLLGEMLGDLRDSDMLELTGYDFQDHDALVALLNSPIYGGGDDEDQGVLDATDRAGWPVIRAQVHPDVHQRWAMVEGDDDADRVHTLLGMVGL
jgi:hypothetical protein